ncbi:MAG TPA: DUF2393 family protein [Granulicella sp.]|jgi:hypothetical protein|nr:DUF2393 family protein [Granulicella sp.]
MSEPAQNPTSTPQPPPPTGQPANREPVLFAPRPAEPPRRGGLLAAGLAALVLILIGVVFAVRDNKNAAPNAPGQILAIDPYATQIVFSQLAMSESTSLSGGTSTFLDGHIRNTGNQPLTGITVQVLFPNDEGQAPDIQTVALSLIRAHEPYVDTQPLSAAPLQPGEEKEFRLIFETVSRNWNQHMPELHVVKVTHR